MARFYSNENFPLPVVDELRRLGHDVLTIQETGRANQALSDEAVLDFARGERRVLVTLNRRHFVHLYEEHLDHAGIVVCTYDSDFATLAQRIHIPVEDTPNPAGQLIRINRPQR